MVMRFPTMNSGLLLLLLLLDGDDDDDEGNGDATRVLARERISSSIRKYLGTSLASTCARSSLTRSTSPVRLALYVSVNLSKQRRNAVSKRLDNHINRHTGRHTCVRDPAAPP